MVWGVAKITLDFNHRTSLSPGSTVPVKATIEPSGSFSSAPKALRCCRTKGLVGARTMTLDFGFLRSISPATMIATIVFPSPVGNTTSVFFEEATSAILFWYSLAANPSDINQALRFRIRLKGLPALREKYARLSLAFVHERTGCCTEATRSLLTWRRRRHFEVAFVVVGELLVGAEFRPTLVASELGHRDHQLLVSPP